jgi:hypothetical protein
MLEKFEQIERALNYALDNVDYNQGKRAASQDNYIYLGAIKQLKSILQELNIKKD